MKRKHLVAIGVSIAILLLLYWLLVAEDMNEYILVVAPVTTPTVVREQRSYVYM